MQELRDIRALEPIHDISFYLFIALILFVVLIIGSLIYLLYRKKRKRKKEELLREEVLKRLHEIDLDDSKKAAYEMSRYGRFLAQDDRSKKILSQLEERLQAYKFIPNPPALSQEAINYYNLFLEVVDG
jgi:cytochrome c biogenesis protein ResB